MPVQVRQWPRVLGLVVLAAVLAGLIGLHGLGHHTAMPGHGPRATATVHATAMVHAAAAAAAPTTDGTWQETCLAVITVLLLLCGAPRATAVRRTLLRVLRAPTGERTVVTRPTLEQLCVLRT